MLSLFPHFRLKIQYWRIHFLIRNTDSYRTLYHPDGLSSAEYHIYPSATRRTQFQDTWEEASPSQVGLLPSQGTFVRIEKNYFLIVFFWLFFDSNQACFTRYPTQNKQRKCLALYVTVTTIHFPTVCLSNPSLPIEFVLKERPGISTYISWPHFLYAIQRSVDMHNA